MAFVIPPRRMRCGASVDCAKHSRSTLSVVESVTNAISGCRPDGDVVAFSIGVEICRTLLASCVLAMACVFGITRLLSRLVSAGQSAGLSGFDFFFLGSAHHLHRRLLDDDRLLCRLPTERGGNIARPGRFDPRLAWTSYFR